MKDRHLQGEDHPLSVEEILDETNQLDIGSSNKNVRNYYKTDLTQFLIPFVSIPVAYNRSTSK